MNTKTFFTVSAVFLFFFTSSCVYADNSFSAVSSKDAVFSVETVMKGLHHPWSFVFLPDGRILVTERRGRLLMRDGDGYVNVPGVPEIVASGQGGLLDIALDPDFEKNGMLFFTHSVRTSSGMTTAVSRGVLSGSEITGVTRIFTSSAAGSAGIHCGSRMVFAPDGTLYVTIGDRGQGDRAQDRYDHAGSVVRMNRDGSVPTDNPFFSGGGDPYLFTSGHRNAQGIAVDPVRGTVWLHEHGPKGGDELNSLVPGANYGWPLVSYGVNYDGSPVSDKTGAPGVTGPHVYWVPSIAPSGLVFYTGDLFPSWKGDIFVGALAGRHLRRIVRDGEMITSQEVLLHNRAGRIRDVRQGPDGAIWFITDETEGALYRIVPDGK